VYTTLSSRIQMVVDTHRKLLEAREEAETKAKNFKMEEKLMVLKQPKPEPAKPEKADRESDAAADGAEAPPAKAKA
jgi:hypothetical protein